MTPFVILARGRTGSSLLRDLLDHHPAIVAHPEFFASRENPRWQPAHLEPTPPVVELLRHDPAAFLERHVFAPSASSQTRAVGFKILYHHAQEEPWERAWDVLAERREVRILHNRRHNLLRTLVSWRRAALTGQWKCPSTMEPEPTPSVRIEISAEDCRSFFQATRERERQFDAFFADHPCLEVVYEELVGDREAVMTRVQEFLGVPPRRLETSLRKQARLPLDREIVDYAKLKREFKGSEWESFFED